MYVYLDVSKRFLHASKTLDKKPVTQGVSLYDSYITMTDIEFSKAVSIVNAAAIGDFQDLVFNGSTLVLDVSSAKLRVEKESYLGSVAAQYVALQYVDIKAPSLKASFQADAQSRTKIDACINRLNNGWTPPVGADLWYDAANGTHPITLTNMNTIANEIATRDAKLFARLQKAKSAIRSATTVAQVQAIIL